MCPSKVFPFRIHPSDSLRSAAAFGFNYILHMTQGVKLWLFSFPRWSAYWEKTNNLGRHEHTPCPLFKLLSPLYSEKYPKMLLAPWITRWIILSLKGRNEMFVPVWISLSVGKENFGTYYWKLELEFWWPVGRKNYKFGIFILCTWLTVNK